MQPGRVGGSREGDVLIGMTGVRVSVDLELGGAGRVLGETL